MRTRALSVLLLLALVASSGCVERKLIIESDPQGAPVWIDERYAGMTPLEYPFAHYGTRSVRVGPVRDENDRVTHLESERVFDIEWPSYQQFPIDFFYEVLYPKTLVDEHRLPAFVLKPVTVEQRAPQLTVEELRAEAEEFRRRALTQVPEEPEAD
jgi:hypothetical protein